MLYNRHYAENIAIEYITTIQDVAQESHICGSIRRLEQRVKDIDLVILPRNIHDLWARLDTQVAQGIIKRGDKWGKTYRNFKYKNLQIELYTCDEHNRAYIQWLRTGPGKLNTYVMTQLKRHQSSVRFQGGYAWHVTYDNTHPNFDTALGYAKLAKLKTENEYELFQLIGLPYVAPAARSEISYGRLNRIVNNPSDKALQAAFYIEKINTQPKQQKLF